jgi:hypothetical protein
MAVDTNLSEGITLVTGTLMPDLLQVCMQPPIVYVVGLMLVGAVFFMIRKAVTRR